MSAAILRLLIDHNVGRGVAMALREAGYDAVFAGDVDPHLSDAVILGWAVREGRLIVTQDNDFGADLLFFDHLGPTGQVWYYDARAVGFSLTKTQKPIAENDLPDCLAMWRAYDAWRRTPAEERPADPPLNDRCWLVSREELARRNFDLSARNPNRPDDFAHRPPEEIAADIADKQARIAALIAEIQELLAAEP